MPNGVNTPSIVDRRDCEECTKHDVLTMMVSQLCTWKTDHELECRGWREYYSKESHNMERDINKRFDDLKMWLIANLVAIIFMLGSSIVSILRRG